MVHVIQLFQHKETMNRKESCTESAKLFDLGGLVRVGVAAHPVDVPHTQSYGTFGDGAAKSAPTGQSLGDVSSDHFFTRGLIDPVMDESQVMLSSSANSSSSVVMRQKMAASGALGRYNTYSGVDVGTRKKLMESSIIGESDYVKIQERNENKRKEHSTTYVLVERDFVNQLPTKRREKKDKANLACTHFGFGRAYFFAIFLENSVLAYFIYSICWNHKVG